MEKCVSGLVSPRHSTPFAAAPADWAEPDFTATEDAFPRRVHLERVEVGRHKYVSADLGDLELLYDLESSSLSINCGVSGLDGASPPASFRITDISAADLSLVTEIPGSLESLVVRLVLETDDPIQCSVRPFSGGGTTDTTQSDSDADISRSPTVSPEGEGGDPRKDGGTQSQVVKTVHSCIVVLTALVCETSNMQDVLVQFLKRGSTGNVCSDETILNPTTPPVKEESDQTDAALSVGGRTGTVLEGVTFLESLPVWARYVPWWVYSRNIRISIQNILFLYSLFSVVWAFWQLYRNVDVIQHVLEPIIAVVKEVYLASVIEVFDWFLAIFTEFWMRYLSPINVLLALFLAPILQVVVQLKNTFLPLGQFLYFLLAGLWCCLPNTHLLDSVRSLLVAVYGVTSVLGQAVWEVVRHMMRPAHLIWQGFLNSRVAVGSLDLNRLKLSWVINLVMGSIRAIGSGVAKLCGYTSRRRKLQMAKNHKYMSPLRLTRSSVQPQPPVYHNSPLSNTSSM